MAAARNKHPGPPRVVFVCSGNTCRSVMAEYVARSVFGDSVIFESAGIAPQPASDAKNAVYTLKKNFNIDASKHLPRDVRSIDLAGVRLVIALEKRAVEIVQRLGVPESRVKLWKIRDPWGGDPAEYDRASLEIKKRVLQLKGSCASL